jgi:hypothetical protein
MGRLSIAAALRAFAPEFRRGGAFRRPRGYKGMIAATSSTPWFAKVTGIATGPAATKSQIALTSSSDVATALVVLREEVLVQAV